MQTYTQQNSPDLLWVAHIQSYSVATASWSNRTVVLEVQWKYSMHDYSYILALQINYPRQIKILLCTLYNGWPKLSPNHLFCFIGLYLGALYTQICSVYIKHEPLSVIPKEVKRGNQVSF